MCDSRLVAAVLDQLGGDDEETRQTAIDAGNHGADAGFNGFTYYSDTIAFAKSNRKLILDSIREDCNNYGVKDEFAMVRGFACLDDEISSEGIALALFGGQSYGCEDADIVNNVLAWYALETVGQYLNND